MHKMDFVVMGTLAALALAAGIICSCTPEPAYAQATTLSRSEEGFIAQAAFLAVASTAEQAYGAHMLTGDETRTIAADLNAAGALLHSAETEQNDATALTEIRAAEKDIASVEPVFHTVSTRTSPPVQG